MCPWTVDAEFTCVAYVRRQSQARALQRAAVCCVSVWVKSKEEKERREKIPRASHSNAFLFRLPPTSLSFIFSHLHPRCSRCFHHPTIEHDTPTTRRSCAAAPTSEGCFGVSHLGGRSTTSTFVQIGGRDAAVADTTVGHTCYDSDSHRRGYTVSQGTPLSSADCNVSDFV